MRYGSNLKVNFDNISRPKNQVVESVIDIITDTEI